MKDLDWELIGVALGAVVVLILVLVAVFYGAKADGERRAKHELMCVEICTSRALSTKDCLKFIKNDCP